MKRYRIVVEYNPKSHDVPTILFIWDKVKERFLLASEMFESAIGSDCLGCFTNRRQAIKFRNKLNSSI